MIAEFAVPGDPISKGRPRTGANNNTFTPARTRNAEAVIATYARRAMLGRAPCIQVVGVAVEFYCKTRRRKDADNMLKTVTDAMNAIVYVDDVQIEEIFVRVHRGVGQDAARTEIAVWALD